MKEILSTTIKLEETLSLKEMLSLHHYSKNYNGMIYLLVNHKLVNLNNLPKLVSFILTSKNNEMKIVAEGPNVKQTLAELKDFFKPSQASLFSSSLFPV